MEVLRKGKGKREKGKGKREKGEGKGERDKGKKDGSYTKRVTVTSSRRARRLPRCHWTRIGL